MFKLSIELGNAAMRTQEDIARALRKVADRIQGGTEEGGIMDDNGNRVGKFSSAEDEPDEDAEE